MDHQPLILVTLDSCSLVMTLEFVRKMVSGQEMIQFVKVSFRLSSFPVCIFSLHFSTVIDCNSLSDPVNGSVVFLETVFGSSATYSCDSGFLLISNDTRVCQEDGQWSGDDPVCQSML